MKTVNDRNDLLNTHDTPKPRFLFVALLAAMLLLSTTAVVSGDEKTATVADASDTLNPTPTVTVGETPAAETITPEGPSVESLVSMIRERYAAITTLTASFVQKSYQAIMQEYQLERGTIAIGKPERMLWGYDEPLVKKVLLDGTFIWLYTREDNHLYREHYDAYSQNLFYQLISGTIDLNETFTISVIQAKDRKKEPLQPHFQQLKLVPRTTHPAIETIVVSIDTQSKLIAETVVGDHYGNQTTCTFSDFVINPVLDRDFFSLSIKANVTLTDFTGQKLPDSVLKDNPAIRLAE